MTFAWAKLWIETLDDWKMGQLSDHLWRRFFEFVLLAKTQDEGGLLPDTRAMAWRLRCSNEEILADLNALSAPDLQLISYCDEHDVWCVTNFAKRQETPMDSAERMRRLREREKRAAYAEDETPTTSNDECDEVVTESDDDVATRHTDKTRLDKTVEERQDKDAEGPASLGDPPPPLERHTINEEDIPAADPEMGALWQSEMLPELQGAMTKATYDQWLAHSLLLGVVDHRAVVQVANNYAVEWCEKRLYPTIFRTVSDILRMTRQVEISRVAFVPQPGGT